MTSSMALTPILSPETPQNRAALLRELRRLLPIAPESQAGQASACRTLPFNLAALDAHLPQGGLSGGALHEIVPGAPGALAGAFGFIVAVLARLPGTYPLIVILPRHGIRHFAGFDGRLSGHGLNGLGFDPDRIVLVETADRKQTLWAMAEALHSGAPQAVIGLIDRLDLKTSQKLSLAAGDAGLPLMLLRPAGSLEASAAATRWRVTPAPAVRDRFGLVIRPRWHLQLERCRNGRTGSWVVEYDHGAYRFSLAAALADPALSPDADIPIRRLAC